MSAHLPKYLAFTLASAVAAWVPATYAAEDQSDCLLQQLVTASDTKTVGELRAACTARQASIDVTKTVEGTAPPPITERLQEEAPTYANRYAMTPHRPNYLLVGSYAQHRPSNASFARDDATEPAQKAETKFQLSLKAPVWLDAFGVGDFFVGYTQRSFWQMYNTGASSPFRETDYEPEMWVQRSIDKPVFGWNVSNVALGFNHQSNGRGHEYSRSWNRVFALLTLEKDHTAVILRPWWRVPERTSSDDNPDIGNYLGNFDLTLVHKSGDHTLDLMLRNNLKTRNNHGAVQLGWSFPVTQRFKGYVQWFYGYGESLIDYNVRQNTIGVGVQLVDW